MTRLRWGALLWILGLLTYPAQVVAAAQWPQGYSWTSNFISDLGVTTCATFDPDSRVERYICSPAHLLANGSIIANGAMLTLGALLLWSAWPRLRQGRMAMSFLALTGLLVVLVGALPWDLYPEAHDVVALAQTAAQWVGMVVLALAVRGSTAARRIFLLTLACLLISITGFILFIDAIDGGPSVALGLGITERLAFDTLGLWTACLGVILCRTTIVTRDETVPRPGATRVDKALAT